MSAGRRSLPPHPPVQAFTRADKNHDNKITFAEYQDYCLTNPEVQAWMAHFDDAGEDVAIGTMREDSELELEAKVREYFFSNVRV